MRVRLAVALLAGTLFACGPNVPASIEFVDMTPEKPGLGEIATVRFRAIDSRGVPMAGVPMTFRLQSERAGVTLNPTSALTNKGDGVASTQLTVNTRVSSVIVVAEIGDKAASSPPLSFAGAVPNARQFTFQCGDMDGRGTGGVHALHVWDEGRNMIVGVHVECTAHTGDRNGDGVVGALVSFLTEAGTIAPTETSVTDLVGNATVIYKATLPTPQDVPPSSFTWTPPNDATHTGEYIAPLWMHPYCWQQNPYTAATFAYCPCPLGGPCPEPRRKDPIRAQRADQFNNPRDNLVTMIAVTAGEEGYDDLNNNGRYDNGEPFDDLTEPFVDDNDNGTWDGPTGTSFGERYIDTNGNGRWDGKNGTYDSNTLIWVANRIIWTGMLHPKDFLPPEPTFVRLAPTGPVSIGHFGFVRAVFAFSDPWLNSVAQNGDSDGCSLVGSAVVKSEPEQFNGPGRKFTYPPVTLVEVTVRDAHDPTSNPPVPPFTMPVSFAVGAQCVFTAAPSGHTSSFTVQLLEGTVL